MYEARRVQTMPTDLPLVSDLVPPCRETKSTRLDLDGCFFVSRWVEACEAQTCGAPPPSQRGGAGGGGGPQHRKGTRPKPKRRGGCRCRSVRGGTAPTRPTGRGGQTNPSGACGTEQGGETAAPRNPRREPPQGAPRRGEGRGGRDPRAGRSPRAEGRGPPPRQMSLARQSDSARSIGGYYDTPQWVTCDK